jgi:hypothetical protein
VKYPCFRISQGLTALANYGESNRSTVVRIDPEMRDVRGDPNKVDFEDVLSSLSKAVSAEEATRLGADLTSDQVEGKLSIPLYEVLRCVPAQALGDPDFWRFIAVEKIRDFVYWRDGENCSHASFGLKSERRIPDCVPLRMFNRAHLASRISGSCSMTEDEIVTSGGADFWQSHVLRVQNRFDPRVVRLLVEAMTDKSIPSVTVLRGVAKEIRQIRSNIVLDLVAEGRLAQALDSTLQANRQELDGE